VPPGGCLQLVATARACASRVQNPPGSPRQESSFLVPGEFRQARDSQGALDPLFEPTSSGPGLQGEAQDSPEAQGDPEVVRTRTSDSSDIEVIAVEGPEVSSHTTTPTSPGHFAALPTVFGGPRVSVS